MKKITLISILSLLLNSCANQSQNPPAPVDSSNIKEKMNYPFQASYSIDYQPGDERNALLVLNCLKKYVDGDIKGCLSYFADTSEFYADRFHFKGSRDSLEKVIGAMRNASVSVSKNFDTWVTLYYPETNETWVTLWYTEKMTDKNGKTDSVYYTDDVLVKNGKILQYDEKQRLFPEPVKKH